MDQVFAAGGGAAISPGLAAMVRRLHFERYAISAADLRLRLEPVANDQQPRRLPMAERSVRQQRQQVQLAGMILSGQLEPSFS